MAGAPTKSLPRPEIFTSGFIDIVNNGQVNASARLIRLFVGEPQKFYLPLSLYSGVSANNFQPVFLPYAPINEQLVVAFINPLSGLVNLSSEGIIFLNRPEKLTRTGILYQAGERLLTGNRAGSPFDPLTGRPVNFLNTFGTVGVYFQTGAWEKSNSKNLGIFWLMARYHWCFTKPGVLAEFIPNIATNGIYTGYSAGFGVEISRLIYLKAIHYRYIKKPELFYLLPIYQLSFNYSLKN